jgi:hypothetical protein
MMDKTPRCLSGYEDTLCSEQAARSKRRTVISPGAAFLIQNENFI